MGIFGRLFGAKRDVRLTSERQLKEIASPVAIAVDEFKKRTQVSWLHIIFSLHRVGVTLLVQSRGREDVRAMFERVAQNMHLQSGVPVNSIMEVEMPPISPEHLATLNAIVWKFANERIAEGVHIDQVGQAYTWLATGLGERLMHGDDAWMFSALLADACKSLQNDRTE